MSTLNHNWVPVLGLALVGCASPARDLTRLVWPDQFHFTYENSTGEVQARGPGFDTEREALLFGLSWDISPRYVGIDRDDLRALILELRQAPPAQEPVTAQAAASPVEAAAPVEEPPPEPIELLAVEPLAEPAPEEPPPVEMVVADVVSEEPPAEILPLEEPPPPILEEAPVDLATTAVLEEAATEAPVSTTSLRPAPAPVASRRTVYDVALYLAIALLVISVAIRFWPRPSTARSLGR